MIKNHTELAARFAESADFIFNQIFKIVKDPFLKDRVTFDAPNININTNSCELWFRIKTGVSNDELPAILEHVTDPSLFKIRSVVPSSGRYCLEYKSEVRREKEWTCIINEIEEPNAEPKPIPSEQESEPKSESEDDGE